MTGITGAGKSEFIRLCTGQNVVVGNDLQSRKHSVQRFSTSEDFFFSSRPAETKAAVSQTAYFEP